MDKTTQKASRLLHKQSHKAGLPPGTLVTIRADTSAPVQSVITVIDYDASRLNEFTIDSVDDCFPLRDSSTVSWINITGVHNIELIKQIGDAFHVHPLAQEDIVNTNQRPKVEDYESFLFFVLKMLRFDHSRGIILAEHTSMVLGPNFVLTFQEVEGDVFEIIRRRLRASQGYIRKAGPDYLVYALIDAVVDNYFAVVEQLSGEAEALEDELFTRLSSNILTRINGLRRETILLRRYTWTLRDVFFGLEHIETPLIKKTTRVHLRDVQDHIISITELAETFRDIVSGMVDFYQSSMSNKMNDVMRFLTVIGTIFIPLSFIAGVYGMNFQHMPELSMPYGYPVALTLMLVVGIVLFLFFKSKTNTS